MIPLTAKQLLLLNYLSSCKRCPSFDEMRIALDLKSKSGVHRLIEGLEERGYIRRKLNRSRAIELIPNPHLPRSLSGFGTTELAREARRRGLYLGHIRYESETESVFVEVAL